MNQAAIIAAASLMLFVSTSGFGQGKDALGERTDSPKGWLEERGIRLEFSCIGEFWANARGGQKQGQTRLHKIGVATTVDTKEAGLWNNGTFFLHALSNQGGELFTEEIVGDSQCDCNYLFDEIFRNFDPHFSAVPHARGAPGDA